VQRSQPLRGAIVKNTGDGFLAEFPSAVEAVRSALQFQTRINHLTTGDVEDRRIAFRVGINIGDVIVEPHDIFGDGMNIAARLESIAEPGGICISSSVYDQVRGKVGVEFTDLGEQNLKNIALRVPAYAAVQDGRSSTTHRERASVDTLSRPRLSIAGSAVLEHQRRSRAGLFRGWRNRKPDDGLVAHARCIRNRSK
jgi:class 3 adenylate cyclase